MKNFAILVVIQLLSVLIISMYSFAEEMGCSNNLTGILLSENISLEKIDRICKKLSKIETNKNEEGLNQKDKKIIESLAINSFKKQLARGPYPYSGYRDAKDVEVCKISRREVNRGDRANGVSEKWFLGFSFLFYNKFQKKWQENNRFAANVDKQNNTWVVKTGESIGNQCE